MHLRPPNPNPHPNIYPHHHLHHHHLHFSPPPMPSSSDSFGGRGIPILPLPPQVTFSFTPSPPPPLTPPPAFSQGFAFPEMEEVIPPPPPDSPSAFLMERQERFRSSYRQLLSNYRFVWCSRILCTFHWFRMCAMIVLESELCNFFSALESI